MDLRVAAAALPWQRDQGWSPALDRDRPRFRPLEFTATCSIATLAPIARRITELAGEVSNFDKAAAKRRRTQQA